MREEIVLFLFGTLVIGSIQEQRITNPGEPAKSGEFPHHVQARLYKKINSILMR